MSSTLSFSANTSPNLVLSPSDGVVRVAASASGVLGTLTFPVTPTGKVSWTLAGAPAGGHFSLTRTSDTTAQIGFSDVPQRIEPYVLLFAASDGSSSYRTAVVVVVRPTLTLVQTVTNDAISGLTVSGHAYDASVPSLEFRGLGGGVALSDVVFIAPEAAALPAGLSFEITDNATARFAVEQPSLANPSGGIQAETESLGLTFGAYHPGTLYDSPENALQVDIVYDLVASSSANLRAGLGAVVDPTTGNVYLDLNVLYTDGKQRVYQTEWTVSEGANGTWAGGDPTGTNAISAVWQPNGTDVQNVRFTVRVSDGRSALTLTAGPIPLTTLPSWAASTALPISVAQGTRITQDAGKTAWVMAELSDLQVGETAQVTLTAQALPSDGNTPTVYTQSIKAGSSDKRVFFQIPIPTNASLGSMWAYKLHATANSATTTREGHAQVLAVCAGNPELVLTPDSATLAVVTGEVVSDAVSVQSWSQKDYTLAQVQALDASSLAQFLANTPNATNSTLKTVSASLAVTGSARGVRVADGSLTGISTEAGVTSTKVRARANGYRQGSCTVTLTSTNPAGLTSPFLQFAAKPSAVVTDTTAVLGWSLQGRPTTLQVYESEDGATPNAPLSWASTGGSAAPTSLATTLDGMISAFVVVAKNAVGTTYSVPVVAQILSSTSSAIPASPVTALLEDNKLKLQWTPPAVDGVAYGSWSLSIKEAAGALAYDTTPFVMGPAAVDGTVPGPGSTSTYTTEFDGTVGYLALQMHAFYPGGTVEAQDAAWDDFYVFPGQRQASLNKTQVDLGEPVTLSLGPVVDAATGNPGDRWYVDFGDGTMSNLMPVRLTSIAKSYGTSGEKEIAVYVVSDYITDGKTKVSLVRSRKFATKLVVTNNEYRGNDLAYDAQPDYHVSGSDGTAPAPASYMAVATFLVRDEVTHELLLGQAVARGADASSHFGTMGVDVYPIAGHPHTLDLVEVASVLSAASGSTPFDPLKITSNALEDAVAGQPLSPFQLQATGGQAPYLWFAKNLPQGLNLTRDGVITGAATDIGSFDVVVSVQDSQAHPYMAEKTLTLFVSKSDVEIAGVTTASGEAVDVLPDATVGTHYAAYVVAAKGVAPYSWSILAGALPLGLSLDTASGKISGWPASENSTTDFDANYTPTFEVTDAVGATASASFPIKLNAMPLTVMAPDQTKVQAGVETVVNIPVVGGRPGYTIKTVTSAPDSGFISGTSIIDGVVRLKISGTFSPTVQANEVVTVSVTDSLGVTAQASFTFTVYPQPSNFPGWVSASLPSKVGPNTLSDDVVTVSGLLAGDMVQVLDVLPDLPAGVVSSVTNSNTQFGVSKTVDGLVKGGNQDITLRALLVRNGLQIARCSRTYCVASYANVNGVAIFDVTPTPVTLGELFAFDVQVPVKNAPDPSVAFASAILADGSSLPLGVSLNAKTGVLYGAARSLDVTTSVIELLDGVGKILAVATVYWQVVEDSLILTPSAALPSGKVGAPFSLTLNVAGTSNYSLGKAEVIEGALPTGLTIAKVAGDATKLPKIVISGTPTDYGHFDVAIRATDAVDPSVRGLYKLHLVVTPVAYLSLATNSLPSILSGVSFSTTLIAVGGEAPYTWSIAGGSLPNGIALDPSTGTLSGITNVVGYSQSVTFGVTDINGQVSTKVLQVVADKAQDLAITSEALSQAVVGGTYDMLVEAVGGVAPYTWSMSPSTYKGLALDPLGALKGVPTEAGSSYVQITVRDSASTPVSVSKTYTLTINDAGTPSITSSPTPLPVGAVGSPYGTSAQRSGSATGNIVSATALPYRLAWHVAEGMTLGTPNYHVIAMGGFRRAYSNTFDLAQRSSVTSAPLYMSVLSGDTGTSGVVGNLGDSPALLTNNHMLAASAKVSETEMFVCGGVGNDPLSGSFGATLNQAFIQAFTVNASGIPTPDGRYTVNGTGTSTLPLPVPDTVTFRRHGHASCRLTSTSLLVCGGMAFTSAGVRDMAVDSTDVYVLTFSRDGAGQPTGFTWTKKASMPVGLVFHKALLLTDGRVMVLGGVRDLQADSSAWTPDANAQGSNLCLIYDPADDSWSFDASLPIQVFAAPAVTLPDGRVLVSVPSDYPGSSSSSNMVDGVSLGLTNCMQVYTPDAAGVGSWAIWKSSDSYRGQTRWGTTLHAKTSNGTVYTMGGEQAQTGLMGNLFNNALVSIGSTVRVLSNPANGRFYHVTNAVVKTGVFLVAAHGVPPYRSWSVNPALPEGLALNSETGEISGTPMVGGVANYTFSVTDSRPAGAMTGTQVLTLTINDPAAPVWDLTSMIRTLVTGPYDTTGTLGGNSFYSQTLENFVSNANGSDMTFSLKSGSMPSGLTLNSSTGQLSGTVTVPGVYTFVVTATNTVANAVGRFDSTDQTIALTVNGFLFLTPGSENNQGFLPGQAGSQAVRGSAVVKALPDASISSTYSRSFSVLNGTAPYTWGITGLPAGCGLSFNGNSTGSAVLAGTPTTLATAPDPYNYTLNPVITVTDAKGITQKVSYSLLVGASAVNLSSSFLTAATVGTPYNQSVTLQGGVPAYTIQAASGIPDGLTYNYNVTTHTLTISGTPTYAALGSNTMSFTIKDASNSVANAGLSLTVNAKAYSWQSGANDSKGVWASDAKASAMPIGIMWERFQSLGYNAAGSHSQEGSPWIVRITGNFTTTSPSLTLSAAGGVSWTATLIQAPSATGTSTAVFAINASAFPTISGVSLTMVATLTDGVVADQGTLLVYTRAASGTYLKRGDRGTTDVLETTNGTVFSATNYTI